MSSARRRATSPKSPSTSICGDGEADLALGGVDVDVAEEVDDHARLESVTPSSASLRLSGAQGDAQQWALRTGRLASDDVDAGVDQVDVEVALLVDLGDLAAHPARVTPPEGRLRGAR